jgi:hypothetical protein
VIAYRFLDTENWFVAIAYRFLDAENWFAAMAKPSKGIAYWLLDK